MSRLLRLRARASARFRQRLQKVPLLPIWLLGVAAFAMLSRGRVLDHGIARGFAEAVESSIGPLDAGRVKELRVALGQAVKQGEVVATMDDAFALADERLAEADLATKRANADAQREALESQVARAGIWVMKAKASEQQDRAELAELSQRVERLDGLVSNQLASKADLEDARQKLAAVKARVATYDTVLKPKAGAPEERNFLSFGAHTYAESVDLRLAPYLRAVEEAEAALTRLRARRAALELRAPFDGQVAAITHRPGEVIHAGDEVLRLVRVGSGRVTAFVPDRGMPELKVGQRVRVQRVGALGLGAPGTLLELGGEVEQLPQRLWLAPHIPAFGRRLVFRLDDPTALVPGEAIDVRL